MRGRANSLTAVLAAGGLLLFGCGGGGSEGRQNQQANKPAATENDIAPTPRDQVETGGTLSWPAEQFPTNYNYNQLDGPNVSTSDIMLSMMPQTFDVDAASNFSVNKDYFDSIELTSTDPQVVTYEINPKATWDDGTPITVKDFKAQWKALNGTNETYQVAATQGYEDIGSVEQGADEREVQVTFAKKFADWQGLFSPLYPATTNSDSKVFNTGWVGKVLTTAGPFKLESIDQTAQALTVIRNDKWWGDPAKLDKIVYRVIDPDAQIDALANGEVHFIDVGPDVNKLERAESTQNVEIRRAAGPNFRHITINGTSPVLQDVNVRRALAKAIDRATIAKAMLGPLGGDAVPLGNHLFMANQTGYQDNSGVVTYDPEEAKKMLDTAGWTLRGDVRQKAGKPLQIRFVIPSEVASSAQESQLIQQQLAAVGAQVKIEVVPSQDFFDKYITPGDFDFTVFSWIGTPFPISSSKSIYAKPKGDNIQQNYARIGNDQIDKVFSDATAELDPDKARAIANQADKLIWAEVHSLTEYQRPDIKATNAKLVNYGALGFATVKYQDIGFVK